MGSFYFVFIEYGNEVIFSKGIYMSKKLNC